MVRLARRSGTSDRDDFGVDTSYKEFSRHRQIGLAGLRCGKGGGVFCNFSQSVKIAGWGQS